MNGTPGVRVCQAEGLRGRRRNTCPFAVVMNPNTQYSAVEEMGHQVRFSFCPSLPRPVEMPPKEVRGDGDRRRAAGRLLLR
jgi:hypothetical protein